MTEQVQILQRRLECLSRDLKVLWIALKVFSVYLRGRRRWVPLCSFMERGSKRAWILFSPSRRQKKTITTYNILVETFQKRKKSVEGELSRVLRPYYESIKAFGSINITSCILLIFALTRSDGTRTTLVSIER